MFTDWLIRLRSLVRGSRVEQELDDELTFHLDKHVDALVRAGVPAAEARRRATLDLGGLDQIKEDCRDARGIRLINELGRDARYAWRMLIHRPAISLIIVLTLAMGIGANTAVFSVINSLLLRQLPVHEPDRLVTIEVGDTAGTPYVTPWTYPIWQQFQQRENLFECAAAWSTDRFNVAAHGEPQYADGIWASGSFFRTLGVSAMLGRTFAEEDDRPGGGAAGPVAVIGYGFWQRQYGGSPDVLGQVVTVQRVPVTIVGVMPPEFFGLEVGVRVDVIVPLGIDPLVRVGHSYLTNSEAWWLRILARMRHDQTVASATQQLTGVEPQIIAATTPAGLAGERLKGYLTNFSGPLTARSAATGSSGLRDRYQRPLIALMTVVAIVLLSACTNVANLLLARATARRHEMTVRAALGASRGQLVRQLFVETIMVASAGAALGLLAALWGSRLLVQQVSPLNRPISLDLNLDWRVLAFVGATALLTTLIFGTAPALRGTNVAPAEAFAEGGRTVVGRTRSRVAQGLVVAQVALSLVLVVAAALFGSTLRALTSMPLGFDPTQILVATLRVPDKMDVNTVPALAERIQDAAKSVPGVSSVGMSFTAPLSGLLRRQEFDVPDVLPARPPQRAYINIVSAGWFATYRTPIVAGRDFDAADRPGGPPVAVVNEDFVNLFLDGASPIGRRIVRHEPDTPQPPWEIVGVVGPTIYRSLREGSYPTVFVPFGTLPSPDLTLSVRSADSRPGLLEPAVARAIKDVSPDMAILQSRPLVDLIGSTLTQERLVAELSGFFGVIALLLAGIGLYGVTSQMINRRRTELGLRLALGATPGSVVRLTLGQASRLVVTGLVLGGLASVWASQFVGTLLYGIGPRDVTAFVASALILAATAALAAWLPARRASRIDPVDVLRGN